MSIQNRNLKAGTKLAARYKGKDCSAEVVKTKEGLRYRLPDGREFKSPSSAGSAVMGGNACNGWKFWTLADEAAKEREPKKPGRKPATKTVVEQLPDQSGIPDGQVRYFCSACTDSFDVPASVRPIGCPQGHGPGEVGSA